MLTTAEIAAFLGVTPAAIRQTVRRHRIDSPRRMGRHKLYDVYTVLAHTGSHDRRRSMDA